MSEIIGKTYAINDTYDVNTFDSFDVSGNSFGFDFVKIQWELQYTYWYYLYAYNASGAKKELAAYNTKTNRYTISNNGTHLLFIGGDDIHNEQFVAWLTTNAHQTENAIYKVWADELTATANAIRQKGKSDGTMPWNTGTMYGFSYAVNQIKLYTDTTNATAFPSDIAEGATAFANEKELIGTIKSANGEAF